MRNRLRLPALAIVAILVVAACSQGQPPPRRAGRHRRLPLQRPANRRRPSPRPSRHRPRSRRRSPPRPVPRAPIPRRCRCGSAPAATRGWSTSSSCAWNAANPTKPINLSYIVAHGDGGQDRPGHRLRRRPGPDGHGPDLRPAVRGRRTAGRHHRPDQELARTQDRQPGTHDGRDVQRPPLRRAALRRRLGPVLQQGPLHEGRSRPEQAADQPGRAPRRTRTRSRPSAAT